VCPLNRAPGPVGHGRILPTPGQPASASRAPLCIHVERFNSALRLYERLGFRQIDDRGVYLFMEWSTTTPNGPTIQRSKENGSTKWGEVVPTGLWDGFHPSGRTASLGSLDRWIVRS